MDSLAQIIFAFFVGMALLAFALGYAEKRDTVLSNTWDCIWEHIEADDFPGDLQEAYETYYGVCSK